MRARRFISLCSNALALVLCLTSIYYCYKQHQEEKIVESFIESNGLKGLPRTYQTALKASDVIRDCFNTQEATFHYFNARKRPLLRHDTATLLTCREGLCGEGTRVLVNVLNEMGFDATRVALYGKTFEAGHALASVRLGKKDVFIDSIAAAEDLHRLLVSQPIGPQDFGITSYQINLEDRREALLELGNKPASPVGEGWIGYSYESIPFNRLFSMLGFRIRVFNFHRPNHWVTALAEKPNAALATFAAVAALLILAMRGAVRLLVYAFPRHKVDPGTTIKDARGPSLAGEGIPRTEILGVPVDLPTLPEARERVRHLLTQPGPPAAILAVNPEKVIRLHSEPGLLTLFRRSPGLLLPDGIGIVLASRMLMGAHAQRIAGADFMLDICAIAAEEGAPLYLFGATPEVNQEAGAILLKRFPGLKIAGASHGFIRDEALNGLVDAINASGAKVLLIALGSPHQERWLASHIDGLEVRVCQGVGGSFDVLTGRVKRAPLLFRVAGLEWFYRLCSEPRRLGRQTALPHFATRVCWQWIRQGLNGLFLGKSA